LTTIAIGHDESEGAWVAVSKFCIQFDSLAIDRQNHNAAIFVVQILKIEFFVAPSVGSESAVLKSH
jgi:hypothetical protein